MSEPHFDYVIVGGGSAGCVVADALSACGKYTVCLIEAGPPDRDPRIKIPFGLVGLMKHPTYDWQFTSAPHAHLNGREVPVPRGRTLGGSGSINSMVYIRGRPEDYDRWAKLGADGWAWRDVLPWFIRQERNATFGATALHGDSGPLHVQDLPSPHPLLDTWQAAGEACGIPRNADFNGPTQEGLGVYQTTMNNGRRWSAADAFLRPALKRLNLTVVTSCHIDRVDMNEGRATGVHGHGKNGPFSARVGRELVLCAGAIASPSLLLKSGIGPGAQLQSLGIEVRVDVPGVGQNLHDHPAVPVFHGGGRAGYGLSIGGLPDILAAPFRYALTRRGLLASNTVEGGGFARTRPDLAAPDVQFHFIPARLGHRNRMIVWGRGYYSDVCLLKPRSRGALALKDRDGTLDINLNLLSDSDDHDQLLNGVVLLREILSATPFDLVRSAELAPGSRVATREQLADYIAERLGTAYHPVGTCRMGKDDGAVVTPQLKVRGTDNVRVIDASVMPEIVAGNTNAPSMMIGAKGADHVLRAGRGQAG